MTYALLQPLVIAVLVIVEVAVFQLRVALAGKGRKRIASGLGATNALISVAALGQVLTSLDRPANVVGYAVGVAAGVYLGATVDERISARSARRRGPAPALAGDLASPAGAR
jgi:uncharacterized protein YebE (UPF0316 family)